MIGGIFETIGKTLGVGKEKYFLELDDAAEEAAKGLKKSTASATKAAKAAVESAKEATVEAAEKAQELVSDTEDKAEATAKTAANKAKSAASDAADQAKSAANAADKAADKGKQAVTKTAAEGKQAVEGVAEEGSKAPTNSAAPTRTTAEDLILNAIASTAPKQQTDNDGNTLAEIKTFSTDYLMTPSRARRRRPGPSLSPFKGMASEVNPRLKS